MASTKRPASSSAADETVLPPLSDDILALRTITTFIGFIQIENMEKNKVEKSTRNKELKVHNALATLSVIEHDIVSLMAEGAESHLMAPDNPRPDGASSSRVSLISDTATVTSSRVSLQDYRLESGYSSNSENENESKLASREGSSQRDRRDALSVLVTPGKELVDPRYIPEAPDVPESRCRRFLKFIVSKNFLRSDTPKPPPTTVPVIKDSQPPPKLGSGEISDIIEYLQTYPENLDPFDHLPLEQHLWMLSKLLSMPVANDGGGDQRRRLLLNYVVGSSYFKIHRRICHPVWSTPFIDSLCPETLLQKTKNFTFRRYQSAKLSAERRSHQRKHDIKFLKTYILQGGKPRKLGIVIPNIVKKALRLNNESTEDLYDADTAMDFRKLLYHLLCQLQLSSQAMKHFRPGPEYLKRHARPSEAKWKKMQAADVPGDFKTFKDARAAAILAGVALMRLCKGAALPMYLQNLQAFEGLIKVSKPVPRPQYHDSSNGSLAEGPSGGSEQPPDGSEQPSQPNPDPGVYHDPELEAAHTAGGDKKETWEHYLDWLKTTVSPFDALWILLDYVDSPFFKQFSGISMRILVAPPVDSRLLSWEALMNNEAYFPSISDWAGEREPKILTNAEIVSVLNKTRKLFNSEFVAIMRQTEVSEKDITLMSSTLVGLTDCGVKTFSTLAEDTISTFFTTAADTSESKSALPILKVNSNTVNDNLKARSELAADLKEKFKPWSYFFDFLNNLDGDTNVKRSFKGTLHCEVCIASLLHERTLDNPCFKDIADELKNLGNIIGVSKRCCPVCNQLISTLFKEGPTGTRQRFIFDDICHDNISACTPPTWLPHDQLKELINKFSHQLHKELIRFIARPSLEAKRLHRINSSGSHGFSDSIPVSSGESDYSRSLMD